MPIRIDSDLPAKAILEEENVFVMDKERACTQDIRPLKIAILNLMPNKLDTELHLLRSLSNTPGSEIISASGLISFNSRKYSLTPSKSLLCAKMFAVTYTFT